MFRTFRQILLLTTMTRFGFGGEDVTIMESSDKKKFNANWHHRDLTLRALDTSWSPAVRDKIAWHADMIDSYLYNPLWWIQGVPDGGMHRLKVAIATEEHLKNLHFDDLTSLDQIETMWRRYLAGTMAGLTWASEQPGDDGVAAAHNIIGVSLHAVQDFFAHSNWVDEPERRGKSWFSRNKLQKPYLYTGTYEHQEHHGIKHHGKISPACSILKKEPLNSLLKAAANPLSPFNNLAVVEQWKKCSDGVSVQPKVFGVELPPNVVYLDPPGIALDSTWQAKIAHRLRDIPDRATCSPQDLFDAAKESALASSQQWLGILDEAMQACGLGQFWNKVKSRSTGLNDEQYEQYHRFPYMFLSAGPYPPPANESKDEWYLRVRVKTSADADAGTDAPIILRAPGTEQAFPLDYARDRGPLLAYDDHEAGDDIAYMVGPFPALPKTVTITNHAADAGDVLVALGKMFVEAVKDAVDAVGDFLLSVIGGHADQVGVTKKVFSPHDLAKIGAKKQEWQIPIRGGDEGTFVVHGWIKRVRDGKSPQLGEYGEFLVGVSALQCVHESAPRANEGNSDEPFLFALLHSPAQQTVQARQRPPIDDDDVDSGEWRHFDITFDPVQVPKGSASIVVPLALWESDFESAAKRAQMLEEFAARVEAKTESKSKEFVDTLGAAIGSDWKVEHVDIYAFNRAYDGEAGTVWSQRIDAWLPAGGTWEFALGHRPLPHRWQLPLEGIKLGGLRPRPLTQRPASELKVLTGARAANILGGMEQKRGGQRMKDPTPR